MFSSVGFGWHALRGVVGGGLFWLAFRLSDRPVVSVALGVAGLIALGGCPLCWLLGWARVWRDFRATRPAHSSQS
jgi:hypothetical protein